MNDISRIPSSVALTLQQQGDMGSAAADHPQQALTDPAQALKNIAQLAATLSAINPSGVGNKSDGNSITNGNGAPQIDGVSIGFSAEDMAATLLVLQGKTQEAQLATAREGINTNKKKLEDQNKQAMDKINDWIQKCKDAAAKSKAGGILGWIKKICNVVATAFAVVAAGVATAATGGAAAPLLALAVLSLAAATVDLASQIDKARGGKGFDHVAQWMDPGALLGKGVGELAKQLGADESQAGIVSLTFAIAGSIAIMAASMVATGGASAVSDAQKMILTASKVGQAVAGIASGATQAAKGGVDIAVAKDQHDATRIQADKKLIDAMIVKLQKQMEEGREDIKKVLDEMMEGVSIVSRMINSAGESRAQIASNLAGKAQII